MPAHSSNAFSSPVTSSEFDVHVNDPIDHLLHCHDRIDRSLTTIQNGVFGLKLADPVLRTEAAAALDYEMASLQLLTRLHEEDEEKSLFPRLKAKLGNSSPALNELMANMETQHRDNDALFGELAKCIKAITSGPASRSDEEVEKLEKLVTDLANLHRPHMNMEKERVFSKLRQQLSAEDLAAMQQEMRARFKGGK